MSKLEAECATSSVIGWPHISMGLLLTVISPVLASYYILEKADAYYMGQFAGYYFIICAVLTLIIGFVPGIKRTLGRALLFGVLFLCCAGVEMSGEGRYSKEILTAQESTELLDQVQAMMVAARQGKDIPKGSIDHLPKDVQNLYGEVRDQFIRFNEAALSYQRSLEVEAYSTILHPKILAETEAVPTELYMSKALLIEASRFSNEYYKGLPVTIEMMDIDSKIKEQFLKGFAASSGKTQTVMKEYFAIEEELLSAFIRIHELCIQAEVEFDSSTNQILFYDVREMERYNRLIDHVSRLTVEESSIIDQISALEIETSKEFLDHRKAVGI